MGFFKEYVANKRSVSMGIAVGLVTYVLAYLVSFFKIVNVLNIGGQRVTTGALSLNIGTTAQSMGTANALGVKAMAYLTAMPIVGGFFAGMINNLAGLFVIIVGSYILVVLGRMVYSIKFFKRFPKYKLATELFYGAVLGLIIIALLGGAGFSVSVIMTLAIYYFIIAFLVTMLAKKTKFYAKLVKE